MGDSKSIPMGQDVTVRCNGLSLNGTNYFM